jgi:hypothetical protein
MSAAPNRPLPPLTSAAVAPLLPLVGPPQPAAVDGPTFRDRLAATLRGLARIEGRVAYEADAMDREQARSAARLGAAHAEADERLATPRERGA